MHTLIHIAHECACIALCLRTHTARRLWRRPVYVAPPPSIPTRAMFTVAPCHPEGQRWPLGRRQRPAAPLKEARKSGKDDGVAGRGKAEVRRFSKKERAVDTGLWSQLVPSLGYLGLGGELLESYDFLVRAEGEEKSQFFPASAQIYRNNKIR